MKRPQGWAGWPRALRLRRRRSGPQLTVPDPAAEARLDAILGGHIDPLTPAPGVWDVVRRRGSRRRALRRAGAVIAVAAAVIAVGVPTAIVIRQGRTPTRAPSASAPTQPIHTRPQQHAVHQTAAPPQTWHAPAELKGFAPASVSFRTGTLGYLLGRTADGTTTLVRTENGGQSWAALPTPSGFSLGNKPVGGVRFTYQDGFLYGRSYWTTRTGGQHWTQQVDPGVITDMETDEGRIWALVRPCPSCTDSLLYSATVEAPQLVRVGDLPALRGTQTQISLDQDAVYIVTASATGGSMRYWTTNGGLTWRHAAGPCNGLGVITALDRTASTVVCANRQHGQDVSRRLYVYDHQASDDRLIEPGAAAPASGNTVAVTANDDHGVVIADDWQHRRKRYAPFEVSVHSGHWKPSGPPLRKGAGFVGFISRTHVVALPKSPKDHEFLTSYDAGRSWQVTSFDH